MIVSTIMIAWAMKPMTPVIAPVVVEVTALMPNFWKIPCVRRHPAGGRRDGDVDEADRELLDGGHPDWHGLG